MKYEFILKTKSHLNDPFERVAYSIVSEENFNNAKKDFARYEARAKDAGVFDTVLLINRLDDYCNFIEVVQ